jgi:hypothetical protein
MQFIIIFLMSVFTLNTSDIAAQALGTQNVNIPRTSSVKNDYLKPGLTKKNDAPISLTSPAINPSDVALIELYNKAKKNTLQGKTASDWSALKPDDVCSESVCRTDGEIRCLRRFQDVAKGKCQQFQRNKISKEISNSIGICPPPKTAAEDFNPSIPPSSPTNNNNLNVPAANSPANASHNSTAKVNLPPATVIPKPTKETKFPTPVVSPNGDLFPAAVIGIGGAAVMGGLALQDDNDDDSIATPSNPLQNPQVPTNGLINLTPTNSVLPGNSLAGGRLGVAAPQPNSPSSTPNGNNLLTSTNPAVTPQGNQTLPNGNNSVVKDDSCSQETMMHQGEQYTKLYNDFIALEDNMYDSINPDKSTTSLYITSLEMLNLAFLARRMSVKKSSIYIVKEFIKSYAIDIRTYFPQSMIKLLEEVCDCLLNEDKEDTLSEKIKAFLEGAAYLSK